MHFEQVEQLFDVISPLLQDADSDIASEPDEEVPKLFIAPCSGIIEEISLSDRFAMHWLPVPNPAGVCGRASANGAAGAPAHISRSCNPICHLQNCPPTVGYCSAVADTLWGHPLACTSQSCLAAALAVPRWIRYGLSAV